MSFVTCESFPRMWDQRHLRASRARGVRIIPTYVGSTMCSTALRTRRANHSHVCGINPLPELRHWPSPESFPRMWDQHPNNDGSHFIVRIIPTYVGSTLDDSFCISYHLESFPRMWDQLFFSLSVTSSSRIIPTYVGSTFQFISLHVLPSNHSHVCGINPSSGLEK